MSQIALAIARIERRLVRRVPLCVDAWVADADEVITPCVTIDLSERGVALYAPGFHAEPGTTARVALELPSVAEASWLHCVVRWTKGYRVGLELVGLTPNEQRAIRLAIEVARAAPLEE